MKKSLTTIVLLGSLVVVQACEESGENAAGVVQAAGKAAGESMQDLGAKLSELSQAAPAEMRAQAQELFDDASQQLKEVKDSETAQRVAEELGAFVDKLAAMKDSLAEKIDVSKLQATVEDLIQRFKDDPRVASAMKSLQEKLSALER